MTKTTEEYGRRPIPADKWVRSTLENALFDARESLVAAEFEKARARVAAAKADEMHLLWQSRISHLEAAMAALNAIPESVPPVGRPWAFPAFLGDGLVSKGSAGLPAGSQGQPIGGGSRLSRTEVELHGVAGALADRPELATPLNTQPLSPPPYCDRCERPLGPGHACLAAEADAARFTALPSSRRPDRTTGEDSQEL